MTNTREEVAVAKAIADSLNDGGNGARTDTLWEPSERDYIAARYAIAASNSKYVAGLVEALKRVLNRAMVHDHEGYEEIAREALNNLPEDLRK